MKIKFKKFQTLYRFDYFLLLITPLVDSINGLFLINNEQSSISIGSIYRIVLIVYILMNLLASSKLFFTILPFAYFPFDGVFRGLLGSNLIGTLTYSIKWILPFVLIIYYSFSKKNKKEIKNCLIRCLDIWCYFVPISLIIEYIFGIGKLTYYDAGFKGLYYSTNDIALALIVLFIYSVYMSYDKDKKYLISSLLNFIAIIILSTKSSLIFSVVVFIYLSIMFGKINWKKLITSVALSVLVFVLIKSTFSSQVDAVVLRYSNMWENTSNDNFISRFLSFATSGRTDRIEKFFTLANIGNVVTNYLFGWIYPDNAHVIEMDWHDLICQYGVIGFFIVFFEYLYLLIKSNLNSKPYNIIIVICIIYSIFAGHVISGAFAGTVFATVFSILILNNCKIN